jgi:hypothetical protein
MADQDQESDRQARYDNDTRADNEGLRDLAGRLLATDPDGHVRKPLVLVGCMPANLPEPFPLPPHATLFGSKVNPEGDHTIIVAEALGAAEEIERFYEDYFRGAGWQRDDNLLGRYVRSDDGPVAGVHIRKVRPGVVDLSLSIFTAPDQSPRGMQKERQFPPPVEPLKTVPPPPGGQYSRGGTTVGLAGHSRFSWPVEADGTLTEVESHYTCRNYCPRPGRPNRRRVPLRATPRNTRVGACIQPGTPLRLARTMPRNWRRLAGVGRRQEPRAP